MFYREAFCRWAAMTIFLLFGKMIILSVCRFSNAARISSVLGFIVWPPLTIRQHPGWRKSGRSRAQGRRNDSNLARLDRCQ